MSGLTKGHGWNKGQQLSNEHRANLKKAWERRKLKAINT
jgi:Ni/Co efflux regulator RcnB